MLLKLFSVRSCTAAVARGALQGFRVCSQPAHQLHLSPLVCSAEAGKKSLLPLTDKPRNRYNKFYTGESDAPQAASVAFLGFIAAGLVSVLLGIPQALMTKLDDAIRKTRADASTKVVSETGGKKELLKQSEGESEEEEEEGEDGKKKRRVGFRDRRIIGYEDRIRAYSTPDKIFRYFATLKCVYEDGGSEVFMTPTDFVRSITPGMKQPEGLGLDAFKRYDPRADTLELNIPEDSVFYCLGNSAIISFTDYIFLLTIISTPQRQFEIAFRMFDLNGDGELDLSEFDVVSSVIRGTTAMGKRHRDHSTTGSTLRGMNSALSTYFFGQKGEQKLTINRFIQFQQRLQNEIIKLEFSRYEPVAGKIREVDFADALLIYAGISDIKKRKMVRRVRQKFVDENAKGLSFQEYADFQQLLRNISDIDTALTFYHLAGAAIDQATLKHVTLSVANVHLSDHLLDVVFTLFDENNDGQLSNKEFVSVMKQRLLRGLDHPMDTGFVRLLSAMFKCGKEQVSFQKTEV